MCDIQKRIVSLIPSETLRHEIREKRYALSEADLLLIAFRYAPDQDTRLQLLRELSPMLSDELKAYAERVIKLQGRMLAEFVESADDAVFELHMQDSPDAYDDRYLCRTYDAAIHMIALFYEKYGGKEHPSSRYRIVKRRVLSSSSAFSEDEIGWLVLLPGSKIHSVRLYTYDHRAEKCDGQCFRCEKCCVACSELAFPPFTKHGDAVRIIRPSGQEAFGIVCMFNDSSCSDLYVIPLDCEAVRSHEYANIHHAHEHVPLPQAERIEAEELPEKMREDYYSCLCFLRGQNQQMRL